jgi:hypothetical protein
VRSPRSRATASGLVASPQSTRCGPSSHRSPNRDVGDSGSGGAAFAALVFERQQSIDLAGIEASEAEVKIRFLNLLQFQSE